MKNILKFGAIASLALILPEMAFAEVDASTLGEASTMSALILGFSKIPLVKGIVVAGAIGGGLYLVLKGFGIIGKDGGSANPKQILLGAVFTGIGLSYDSIIAAIADKFA